MKRSNISQIQNKKFKFKQAIGIAPCVRKSSNKTVCCVNKSPAYMQMTLSIWKSPTTNQTIVHKFVARF